jgi:hypothetical protein
VHDPAVGRVRHDHLKPVLPQPADVELLLHRVRGRQQADFVRVAVLTASAVVSAM